MTPLAISHYHKTTITLYTKHMSMLYMDNFENDIDVVITVYRGTYIAPIAQLVSALDFNFERAVEGSILTAGKRLSLKI